MLKSPTTRAAYRHRGDTHHRPDVMSPQPRRRSADSRRKLAMYSYWKPGGMDIDTSPPIDRELYDYWIPSSRHEVDDTAAAAPSRRRSKS